MGVSGTGVGSSRLECLTSKRHTFLFWINAAKAEISSYCSVQIREFSSLFVGVPGTGVGSRWLECLTSKLHTSLFRINAAKAVVSS